MARTQLRPQHARFVKGRASDSINTPARTSKGVRCYHATRNGLPAVCGTKSPTFQPSARQAGVGAVITDSNRTFRPSLYSASALLSRRTAAPPGAPPPLPTSVSGTPSPPRPPTPLQQMGRLQRTPRRVTHPLTYVTTTQTTPRLKQRTKTRSKNTICAVTVFLLSPPFPQAERGGQRQVVIQNWRHARAHQHKPTHATLPPTHKPHSSAHHPCPLALALSLPPPLPSPPPSDAPCSPPS